MVVEEDDGDDVHVRVRVHGRISFLQKNQNQIHQLEVLQKVGEESKEVVVEEDGGDVHDLYGLLEEQRPKPRQ